MATVDLSRNCRYGDDVRSEILGSQGALLIDLLPRGRVRLGYVDGMVDLGNVDVDDVTAAGVANQAVAFAAADARYGPAWPWSSRKRPGDIDRPRRAAVHADR